ncbi:hypothetical protein FUAX_09590 [Fulvitalea axinellae]|uniref:Prenyltransferase n=1 Tax=Fulvitalea axinellae TaxID=1182444 RepID=A0AAU9CT05_9BACT|nr:hypothetical protein FUAX_09590 [Fulvitalea axinellae]
MNSAKQIQADRPTLRNGPTPLALFGKLVRSQIFISLAGASFFLAGLIQLGHQPTTAHWLRALLVFASTALVYNINNLIRKTGLERTVARLVRLIQQHALRSVSLAAVAGAVGFYMSYVWLGVEETLFLAVFGFLSLAYNFPDAIPFRKLRSLPLLKIFLIALVWASTGALYPALLTGKLGQPEINQLFWAEFLFIFAITLPFDIRDYYSDRQLQLLTIPGLIGTKNTKYLALVSWLGFVVLAVSLGISPTGLALLSFLGVYAIVRSGAGRHALFYTGFIDGLIILFSALLTFH